MTEFGLMCVVALERMAYLDAPKLTHALRAVLPHLQCRVTDREHDTDRSGVLVEIEGHDFAMVSVDGHLPQPEFASAIAPNPLWPGADDLMDSHEAFVIISASRPAQNPAMMRAQAVAVTRLAAVLCEVMPVIGVYVQGAAAAVPPQRVRQAIGDLNQNRWPADIWIGYDWRGQEMDGGGFHFGIRSKGAVPYIGCEVDIPPRHVRDKPEILNLLFRVMSDLLSRGRNIRDGEPVRLHRFTEAHHQVRFVSHGKVPVVALRELEEPVWGVANVST